MHKVVEFGRGAIIALLLAGVVISLYSTFAYPVLLTNSETKTNNYTSAEGIPITQHTNTSYWQNGSSSLYILIISISIPLILALLVYFIVQTRVQRD